MSQPQPPAPEKLRVPFQAVGLIGPRDWAFQTHRTDPENGVVTYKFNSLSTGQTIEVIEAPNVVCRWPAQDLSGTLYLALKPK